MIDIHSHILPGVDDGAKTEADSLAMAKAAVKDGIHTMIATPHHRNGHYDNERSAICMQVDILNELFEENQIPLTILPGQETRINGDMITELEQGIMQPLNHTKYVFVEFPSDQVPHYTEQILYDMQLAGYLPVIVHPERNNMLLKNPSKLYDLVKKGALTQITAASVIGKFGKETEKFTHQLLESNLAHFIATDAHNTKSRGFVLSKAYEKIQSEFGYEMYYTLHENAELLIAGKTVTKFPPERIKKKKFLGLF